MFGKQRNKHEGQQRHQCEVANEHVFKCRLKVDSDDDDVTNDGKLFHARAASVSFHPPLLTAKQHHLQLTSSDGAEQR